MPLSACRTAFFLLWLVMLTRFIVATTLEPQSRDVCVLGAGAAGMSAAVFLKDRGYSVVVFEVKATVGGQCNTVPITPQAAGQPSWLDIGVQIFANTTSANAAGLGPWQVDSVAFAERFAGAGSALALGNAYATPNYAVDLSQIDSTLFEPAEWASLQTSAAFGQAYGKLQGILAQYPWIDTASVPDPVPEELLVPFSTFITNNSLDALVVPLFAPQLFSGGLGDFNELTTLYALLNMAPTIQRIFTAPNAGFSVYGGCQNIYEGMTAYLGEANVITNAHVNASSRPESGPVSLSVVVGGGASQSYTCDKLIVAYPQLSSNMAELDLDATEHAVFDNVRLRYYFTGLVEANGTLVDQGPFVVINLHEDQESNVTSPAALPAVTQVFRSLSFGPAQVKASSTTDMVVGEMKDVITNQLENFPPGLLTNFNVTQLYRHDFQPYFTTDYLKAPNVTLAELQGHRNTFYVGSLLRFPATYLLWEDSFRLVSANFPDRNASPSYSGASVSFKPPFQLS